MQKNPVIEKAKAVLSRHKKSLLLTKGCTGVGIGLRKVNQKKTNQVAIIIFLQPGGDHQLTKTRLPKILEGVLVDVQEMEELKFELTATDPFARLDPLIGGISMTPWEAPPTWGSIGCFMYTPGDPGNGVPAGNYLLSCQHVLKFVTAHETRIIQPKFDGVVPPNNYACGNYVKGYQSPTRDCAISTIGYGRTFSNEVPNYPWYPGRRPIKGIAQAAPGQLVYKYGATTKFTTGKVALVHYTPPNLGYQDVILISTDGGTNTPWVAKGDSGSVTILQSNDHVIGLNFAGTPNSVINPPPKLPALPAYSHGFAYDIQSQMNAFSAAGGTRLS